MATKNPRIGLSRSRPIHVRTDALHMISLAQFAAAHTSSRAANSIKARIRLQAERDQALEEVSRLREELRIKELRTALFSPHRGPSAGSTRFASRKRVEL